MLDFTVLAFGDFSITRGFFQFGIYVELGFLFKILTCREAIFSEVLTIECRQRFGIGHNPNLHALDHQMYSWSLI